MIRGIYSSASGMLADQTRMDVLANNLANASTTGYKKDYAVGRSFQDLLLERVGDRTPDGKIGPTAPVGPLGLGSFIVTTATRVTSGNLRHTGNPLDVAIMGDGFFTVSTPHGIRYTRQGAFVQDAEGMLSTLDGYRVLVGGQEVGGRGVTLSINDEGVVLADGAPVGPLDIVTTAEIGLMKKEGGTLWAPAGPADAVELVVPERSDPRGPFQVRAGFLESANVEPVLEMVDLITTMRSYEANQKALQAQDESLGKAVNEVGRL